MRVQFIDLGRKNINKVITVKDNSALRKEIKKHILSKYWDLEEMDETNTSYAVVCGVRTVGEIKILEP